MTNLANLHLLRASYSDEELHDFLMEQQADEFEQSSGELMDWLREEFDEDVSGDFEPYSDGELPF
jgi:hypothetical protein